MIITFNILENLIKRCFLYIFLLIFIVGFLVFAGFFDNFDTSLNKILNPFTATITPDFLPSQQELAPIVEQLVKKKEKTNDIILESGPELKSEQKLTFTEIQEILDDIAERIDIISQEITELVGESPQISEEIIEDIEEEELEEEQQSEEQSEKEEEKVVEEEKPRRKSGGGGSPLPKPSYPKILISEVQIFGEDSEKEEFVELYNLNETNVDLTDWYIQRKTEGSSSFSTFAPSKLFSGKTIRSKDYFLIAREDSSFSELTDIVTDYPLTEDNTLALKDPNREIKDKVGWGGAQDYETAPAENPLASQSLGRKWNSENQEYQDSDNNKEDFEIQRPTPKVENSSLPLLQPILEVFPEIIEFSIIEFDTEPQSKIFTIGNKVEGILEWDSVIEYDSPSFEGINWLSIEPGFGMVSADTPSEVSVFPDISNLTKGVFTAQIIINSENAEESPKEIEVILTVIEKALEDTTPPEVIFDLEPLQSFLSFPVYFEINEALGAATPSGLDAFIFRWKEENEEWQDDYQKIEGAPLVYSGEREFTGEDGHTYYLQIKAKDIAGNESNWLPDSPLSIRISLPKTVLINEIQVDSQIGAGGTNDDWVELYNPNKQEIDLSQWSIQRSPKSGTIYKKNFEPDHRIPANGYFLVVRNDANQDLLNIADMTCSVLQLSSDHTVYLVKNQEELENGEDLDVIDKVGFGQESFSPEGNPAIDPPEEKSIERKELGIDTNDNSQDFEIKDPTPTNSKGEG